MISNESGARSWLEQLPEWNVEAAERLELLARLLAEENAQQNLVSAPSLSEVWRRHIADSAQLLAHVSRESSSPWLDVGTGAGFPGLVIAALRPECEVVMVESRARRIEWLKVARIALGHGSGDVDRRGGLAHPAFLVGDRNANHGFLPFRPANLPTIMPASASVSDCST